MINLNSYTNKLQNRLRSKVLWTSLITLILFVVKEYFDIEISKVNELLTLVMTCLIGFGILNNPTDKNNF